MYYEGLNAESGKKIDQEDAFGYACERCLSGTEVEQITFMELAMNIETMEEFASKLVEWFYSGNWTLVREETKNECAV